MIGEESVQSTQPFSGIPRNGPFLGCRKELFGENGRDYLTAQVFAPWAIDMGRQQLLGVAFAASRERLKQAAEHRGCQRLANVNGCPT